ncbi:submaxillary gland androgen-regulated protein 3B-like [Pecten maximus]|uniref:submaxillary gland androgen-regulated protein 3B-like n=1 Tax=Pecten maximus TaxID=6579 RepID=UPI001458EE89|nr:submaxillary gland androgen-regulated protein 3B-like [Pecten maximus]
MKYSHLSAIVLISLLVSHSVAQTTLSLTNTGILGTALGLGALYYLYEQNNRLPPFPPILPPPQLYGPSWGPNPFWRPRHPPPPPPPPPPPRRPPFFGPIYGSPLG